MAVKKTTQKADAVEVTTAEAPEVTKNTKAKKTAAKTPTYYATEDFYDSHGKRSYKAGDEYVPTSEARTKALLEAKKSDFNKIGRVFLTEDKPEGK